MSGDTPSILLHLGAPLCGAERLYEVLARSPAPVTPEGVTLAWTPPPAPGGGSGGWPGLRGMLARTRPGEGDAAGALAALDQVRRRAGTAVPLVPAEAWFDRAEEVAAALPHWFDEAAGPPVGICASVRPPLDWLNAAWWREGVWTGRGFGSWLARRDRPYALGTALGRWAALPNTRLLLLPGEDAAGDFAAALGLDLPRPVLPGAELPPALIGFLLRNPRYGEGMPDNPAEAAVRRWCPVEEGPRPWAVLPRHLREIRAATAAEVERLLALLPEAEAAALCAADPRWDSEAPYAALLRQGRTPLEDPEDLARLYRALLRGLRAAAEAAGRAVPQLPPVLATRASVHSWDVAVAQALEHLIALDAAPRRPRPFGL